MEHPDPPPSYSAQQSSTTTTTKPPPPTKQSHLQVPQTLNGEAEGDVHGVFMRRLGRKVKDRVTGSTHFEREQRRRQREAKHVHFRAQSPQLLGSDADGKWREVFVEPPYGGGRMGGGYAYDGMGIGGGAGGGFGRGGRRYLRPGGYGGGYEIPLLGLGGGLLLGSLLF